jgi:geranylgeranyl diphosphate synthase type II
MKEAEKKLAAYRALVEQGLTRLGWSEARPSGLYRPMEYFLALGGKRLRPVLCLMACDTTGQDPGTALPQAIALELFHNFTLLHDDIMDQSPLRRGQATVHLRYDVNAAILSGDALMIEAYRHMVACKDTLLPAVLSEFNRVALQVCQGQQLDMEFQDRLVVSLEEYREMIGLKTAVLLGSSLKIGALVGGAKEDDAQKMFRFGYLTGLAFQVQDDWLDVFGDPARFGKQVAGDIKACKHSFLRVMAHREAGSAEQEELEQGFARIQALRANPQEADAEHALDAAVQGLIATYQKLGIEAKAIAFKDSLMEEARLVLGTSPLGQGPKAAVLMDYANYLANRNE